MARSPETSLIMAVICCCDNSVRSSFSCPVRIPVAHARQNMLVRTTHFAFMSLPLKIRLHHLNKKLHRDFDRPVFVRRDSAAGKSAYEEYSASGTGKAASP